MLQTYYVIKIIILALKMLIFDFSQILFLFLRNPPSIRFFIKII